MTTQTIAPQQQAVVPPTLLAPPTPTAGTLMFVYGTLRAGHGNHRLLEGARFVGVRHTQPAYTMLHLGGFPGVVEGGNTSILGEVYEVTDPEMLHRIDRLEGHPVWYTRTPITTIEGDQVEIYIYPSNRSGERLRVVESGDWNAR